MKETKREKKGTEQRENTRSHTHSLPEKGVSLSLSLRFCEYSRGLMSDFLLLIFVRFFFFSILIFLQNISLFSSSVFFPLLWNLSEREQLRWRSNFIFLALPLVFLSREVERREKERERAFVCRGRLSHDEFYYSYYYCECERFENAKFVHARREKNRAKTREIRQREQQ